MARLAAKQRSTESGNACQVAAVEQKQLGSQETGALPHSSGPNAYFSQLAYQNCLPSSPSGAIMPPNVLTGAATKQRTCAFSDTLSARVPLVPLRFNRKSAYFRNLPMPAITLTTQVNAPIETVFDLSRSIDLHVESTYQTNEKAIAGCTSGLINLGDKLLGRQRTLEYASN